MLGVSTYKTPSRRARHQYGPPRFAPPWSTTRPGLVGRVDLGSTSIVITVSRGHQTGTVVTKRVARSAGRDRAARHMILGGTMRPLARNERPHEDGPTSFGLITARCASRHARRSLQRLTGSPTTRRGFVAVRRPVGLVTTNFRPMPATRTRPECASSIVMPLTVKTGRHCSRALDVARQGGEGLRGHRTWTWRFVSVVPGARRAAPGGLRADEIRRFVRALATSKTCWPLTSPKSTSSETVQTDAPCAWAGAVST